MFSRPPTLPRVLCAKCNKSVDRVSFWCNDERQERILLVHCHGATDKMVLSADDIMRYGDQFIGQVGTAFQHGPAIEQK